MDRLPFSTKIIDRIIALQTAADVVRFSFIVQPSVSYLDLQLCKNSPISDYFESLSVSCVRKRLRSFVNTEERCRKFFTPSRELLYTLHLDLHEGRENSLRDFTNFLKCNCSSNSPHVSNMIPSGKLFGEILSNLIRAAFDMNVPKMKMLEMLVVLPFSDEIALFRELSVPEANEFIECFYPHIPNSGLFTEFVINFNILDWTNTFECPEKLEYLLYCARHLGNQSLQGCEFELVSECLLPGHFKNIGPVLKYVFAATTVEEHYEYYSSDIQDRRPGLTEGMLEDVENRMGTERAHLIVQIIWIYFHSLQDGKDVTAAKALGLVWNSIPDPYVTYTELEMGFGGGLSERDLEVMHHFYKEAVGQSCENLEPRRLKHLCRTVVRTELFQKGLWIPEGIKRLPLPESLQLYLNLDQSLYSPVTDFFCNACSSKVSTARRTRSL